MKNAKMTFDVLVQKWGAVEFESSWSKTPQFKQFVRDFHSALKREFSQYEITMNVGHFYVSGFITKDNRHVYFSVPDVRFFPRGWNNNVLARTAISTQDYCGGMNNRAPLHKLAALVNDLLGVPNE